MFGIFIQVPSESSDDDTVDGNGEHDLEESMKERKKRLIPRHTSFNQTKRPWRDPDRHPRDIYFKYGKEWNENTLLNLSNTVALTQRYVPTARRVV